MPKPKPIGWTLNWAFELCLEFENGMILSGEADKILYYEYFVKKTGLDPNLCVFIDDYKKNIIAARKIGFKGILFKNLKQLKKELSAFSVNIN